MEGHTRLLRGVVRGGYAQAILSREGKNHERLGRRTLVASDISSFEQMAMLQKGR